MSGREERKYGTVQATAKGRWMGAVAEENNPKGKSLVKKPSQALTQGLCS